VDHLDSLSGLGRLILGPLPKSRHNFENSFSARRLQVQQHFFPTPTTLSDSCEDWLRKCQNQKAKEGNLWELKAQIGSFETSRGSSRRKRKSKKKIHLEEFTNSPGIAARLSSGP